MRNDATRRLRLFVKRSFDVIVCLLITIIGLPLFILIALSVRLSSPGPIFFIQERVGLGQKVFRMVKFRTMTPKADGKQALVWTQEEEARITSIGRFLRDYGLDELPQVLNILRGDMSIIGPRPAIPAQVRIYTEEQRKVFQMRPGVLSLAAVEGRRSIPMEKRSALHVHYVETWSLKLDLVIFWRCFFVVIGRRNLPETPNE